MAVFIVKVCFVSLQCQLLFYIICGFYCFAVLIAAQSHVTEMGGHINLINKQTNILALTCLAL